MHEATRIFALVSLVAAVWVPALRWQRMSETQRYLAMIALGAAIVFYMYHPTYTACELEEQRTGAVVCDDSGP